MLVVRGITIVVLNSSRLGLFACAIIIGEKLSIVVD